MKGVPMLTIEEKIARSERFAKLCGQAEIPEWQEECEQLAEWLRELQERRKEPEVIFCKDCIYYNWDCVDAPYGMTKTICWCDLHYDAVNDNLAVNPDDFCSRAGRRTDGQK